MFGFQTFIFGDRLAAFLKIAIRRTAEMHRAIDPVAAHRIQHDRYVDDLSTGGTPDEVMRFVGDEQSDFQCTGTVPTIFAQSSLRLKVLVASGESDPLKIAKLGGKILGIDWNPTTDELSFCLSISLLIKDKAVVHSTKIY